jgi:hypothetical protein
VVASVGGGDVVLGDGVVVLVVAGGVVVADGEVVAGTEGEVETGVEVLSAVATVVVKVVVGSSADRVDVAVVTRDDVVGSLVSRTSSRTTGSLFDEALFEEARSAAEGGAMIWTSTTETPAHATPTAAAVAPTHMTTRRNLFIRSVSPVARRLMSR